MDRLVEPLDQELVNRFRQSGFAVLPQLVSVDALSALREAYDALLSGAHDTSASRDRLLGGKTRQIVLPERSHPLFRDNPALDAGRSIARALRGWDAPAFFYSQLLYKPPGHPHETPWHQDDAYGASPFLPAGSPLRHTSLQFWLAMDDVDEENGCMHFHPPPLDDRLLPHHVSAGDPDDDGRLLSLVHAESHIDESRVTPCPIPAGCATVHDSGTLHYTPPNRSLRPRRAYIFNFCDPEWLRTVSI